ncbi:MAG: alanine racemase [Campylobacterales bacterium]
MALITLSRGAFFHNVDVIAARTGIERIAAVLKDNAYGHGLEQMANLAIEAGITKAVVRTVQEASLLVGKFERILVLGRVTGSVPEGVEVALNALEVIEALAPKTRVHLKIDTGMHRSGIALEELDEALGRIEAAKLELVGFFSHLRGADELSTTFFWQRANFQKARQQVEAWCRARGYTLPACHLHNSAGIFRQEDFSDYDWVRPGIALYGYLGMDPALREPALRPVLKLWGEKIATRTIPKGAKVGYNGAFTAPFKMEISTYDVGYGDGFFRFDGSEGLVTPSGKKVLGKVSMDMVSIEGSDEKVCIMDDAAYIAKLACTISYEVTTRLSPSIPRVIVD